MRVRWGAPDLEGPFWKGVYELYLRDQIVEAYGEAMRLNSASQPNIMKSLGPEYLTRLSSHRVELREGLELEYIPHELGTSTSEIQAVALENCEAVASAFGWDWHEKTLITILASEAEADVLRHDWGYYVDKYPYDKICIPNKVLHLENQLARTLRHEFAHVVTTNQSGGHEPTWLSEGLSMLAEGAVDFRPWIGFQAGRYEWEDPSMLGARIRGDRLDPTKLPLVNVGYAQACYLTMYLRKLGGQDVVRQLLTQLGDQSFGVNLKRDILGRSHVDDALRHLLEKSEVRLFDDAHDWVMGTSSSSVAGLAHL